MLFFTKTRTKCVMNMNINIKERDWDFFFCCWRKKKKIWRRREMFKPTLKIFLHLSQYYFSMSILYYYCVCLLDLCVFFSLFLCLTRSQACKCTSTQSLLVHSHLHRDFAHKNRPLFLWCLRIKEKNNDRGTVKKEYKKEKENL